MITLKDKVWNLLDRADKSNDIKTKVDTDGNYIRTPYKLCEEIIEQIRISRNDLTNKKILVVDTIEFIPVLLAFGLNKCNITYIAPYEFKGKIASTLGCKVIEESLLDWKNIDNMKFDVVIGNPPYQNNRDKLFYQKFVNKSFELSCNVVAMIAPAGWTSIADLKSDFTKKITNGLILYKYLGNYFSNVQLMTVYFISEIIPKTAEVQLYSLEDNIVIPRKDIIYFPTKTTLGISIIKKIKNSGNSGLISKSGKITRREAIIVDNSDYRCIFTAGRKGADFDWKFVDSLKGVHGIGDHKVIVTHQTSIENLGEVKYASPNYGVGMGCHAFKVHDKTSAENLIYYLETKFIKIIVKTLKGSVASNSHSLFSNIPLLDFNKRWTDTDLYKYFNLTNEEINYIEETINI